MMVNDAGDQGGVSARFGKRDRVTGHRKIMCSWRLAARVPTSVCDGVVGLAHQDGRLFGPVGYVQDPTTGAVHPSRQLRLMRERRQRGGGVYRRQPTQAAPGDIEARDRPLLVLPATVACPTCTKLVVISGTPRYSL